MEESKSYCFSAKLVTNFDRKEFNLFNQEENSSRLDIKILGTLLQSTGLKGEKFIALYYPSVS